MRKSDVSIGRIFGSYQIRSKIACGSFGCVYLAQHRWLNRVAAIKLLHAALLHSALEQQRFQREARILERLLHPSIVGILDYGVSDGLPYLVLEYAAHGSLSDLLKRHTDGLLTIEEALTILSQIGGALHFAHQQGIIHHDLKPANILFNSEDRALLTDFGIAIARITTTVRHPAASAGTPRYMAPEQFRGKVGPKSDQYALGCIAYELFTGRPPFLGENTSALAYMHLYETPVAPRQLNPDLPWYIEYAILRALEKDSSQRYPDVASFIAALQAPPQSSEQVTPLVFRRMVAQMLREATQLSEQHRYEEALALCDQALQLHPNYLASAKLKCKVLAKLNRFEEALALSQQITHLAPDDSRAWKAQGDLLCKLKRYREAVAAYTQAIQLDPENPFHYYALSNALDLLGWYDEARRAYEKARQLGL